MDFQILEYEPKWADEVCRLQRLQWSGDIELNRRYLAWKYQSNPCSADSILYLAVLDGDLVGMRGYYACRWSLSLERDAAPILSAADAVVRPEMRNHGVSRALLDHATGELSTAGRPLLLNTSAGKSSLLGLKAAGWRSLGRFDILERQAPVSKALRAIGLAAPPGWKKLDQSRNDSGVVIERRPRTREMAALVGRARSPSAVRLHRDAAFFAWRFGNPLCEYRFLYPTGDNPDAYLVLQRWKKHDGEWVNLVDYACLDPLRLAPLVALAADACGAHRMRVWDPADDGLRQVFAASGFRPAAYSRGVQDPRPAVLVKVLSADAFSPDDPALEFARWDRAMIVSDYY